MHTNDLSRYHAARRLRSTRSRGAGLVAAALAALLAATGCGDDAATTPASGVGVRASVAAGSTQCSPAPVPVTRREVAAGTEGDANGNGIVCDRDDGAPGLAMVTTQDDDFPGDLPVPEPPTEPAP